MRDTFKEVFYLSSLQIMQGFFRLCGFTVDNTFKKNCVQFLYCCTVTALIEYLSELLFSFYVAIAGCTSNCTSETIKIIQFHLNQFSMMNWYLILIKCN